MDFKQFEYVLAIAEEKSFSKAAKKLYISQPSLSQYINRLETQLGVLLFDRTTSPLALTYEGSLYIDTANKILRFLSDLQKNYDDISKLAAGRLNIGLTPSKANNPLPQILPVFRNKYPNVELIITEDSSANLEEMLVRGQVDVCIMNLPIKNKGVEYERIFDEKILLAAPPESSISSQPTDTGFDYIDLSLLQDEQFILLKPGQRLRQIADNIFAQNGFKPKILLETRSIETSLRLSASGMGYSFVPEASVMFSGLLHTPKYYTICHPPLTWSLVVAYRTGTYRTKASLAFADVVKEVCSNAGFQNK